MVSGWTFGSTFNTTTNNNNNANNNTSMSDIGNGSYQFANGDVISLNDWPPAPVAWLYNAVDLLCVPLQCAHTWRGPISMLLRTIGSGTTDDNGQESWLSEHYRIPSITQHIPPLLSYDEFRGRDVLSSADEDDNWYYSPDALYRFAFSTSSTSLGRLSTPTAFAVLCLLTLTLRTIKAVLLPAFAALGHKAALRSHGEAWIQANQIRMVKFGEYVFRLLYHSVISVYGLWCFHDKQWWKPGQTISVFQGYPLHDIEPGMAWYYLLQSAYNVEAFLSLMQMSIVVKPQWIRQQNRQHQRHQHPWQWPIAVAWSSTVRGDFQEMCIHHIVTNVLVFGSSALHFTRIGSMVFLVHDVSGM